MEDFVIPTSKSDLLDSKYKGYNVRNVCNPSDLPYKLSECKDALQRKGMDFILGHFDALFSFLMQFSKIEIAMSLKAWEFALKAYKHMVLELEQLLKKKDQDDLSSVRIRALNATKMMNYILIQLMRCFQDRPAKYVKGRGKSSETESVNWPEHCHSALIAIYDCLQLPLRYLWDPPCCDDSFSDLIGSACFTALEDTNVTQVKYKPMRETMFHIFGTLVKHYNYGFSLIIRIGQMLNRFEHVVSPLAQCVVVLLQDYECHSIVHEVLQEIARVDSTECEVTTPCSRSLAQFIVELSESVPNNVAPHVKLLLPILDMEPYVMRNAVLSACSAVILFTLTKENLPKESRDQRDMLLEQLLHHVLDSNAFVRSKVLQIWRRLHEEHAIPISQQAPVLKLAVGRLQDKSNNVRKNAVLLIGAFLKQNPFAAKLGKEDITKELEVQKKLLEEMESASKAQEKDMAEIKKDEDWHELAPSLEEFLRKEFENSDVESPKDSNESSDVHDLSDHLCKIRKALEDGKFESAYKLLLEMEDQLPSEVLVLKSDVDLDGQIQYYIQLLRNIFMTDMELLSSQEKGEEHKEKEVDERLESQRKLVCFVEDSMLFLEQLDAAVPAVLQLLRSLQSSDMVEAVEFLSTVLQFGLAQSDKCVSQLLSMVMQTHDKNVKVAVSEACKIAFLATEGLEGRAYAERVVQDLINLLKKIDIGQHAALEALMSEWTSSGALSSSCIQVLWEIFLKMNKETNENDSYFALVLLNMVANGVPDIVKSRVSQLIAEGFGSRGENDFRLVSFTCRVLQKYVPKTQSSAPVTSFRLPVDCEMFVKLLNVLEKGFGNLDDPYYSPMVMDGIDLMYHLSQEPMTLMENLLESLRNQFLSLSENQTDGNVCESGGGELIKGSNECDVRALTRLVAVVGHVALRHTMYLEKPIYLELKRRCNVLKEKQGAKRNSARKNSKTLSTSNNISAVDASVLQDSVSNGSQAEDREADAIRNVCETELLAENSMLGQFSILVIHICSKIETYTDLVLRRSAFLALSKMMVVSSVFCAEHMQLLVTAMSSSTDEMIRAHCLLAMAEMAFRFPNVVEPWSSHIYSRLGDSSNRVRQTAVMIMTHLVMNDMVKIRSQVSDLALCITDENQNIANLALVFFRELSQKGNALYNALPDIISRLSSPQLNLEQQKFQCIIKFILNLIQKERQVEMLVEKLCQRFRTVTTDRQTLDLMYCLSLLQYSERALRRLQDGFMCYADKLHIEDVHSAFENIITNAVKKGKPEVKMVCEELQMLIDECLKKGVNDPDGEPFVMPSKTPMNSKRRGTKTPCKSTSRLDASVMGSTRKSSSRPSGRRQPSTSKTKPKNSKTPIGKDGEITRRTRSVKIKLRLPSSSSSEDE